MAPDKAKGAAALVATGLGHHRAGRWEQAETAYRAALARDGAHADALHYLALVLHQKGDAAQALPLIERAAARQPGNADLHANRGEVLRALGRNAEAKACYERALALVPGHGAALYNLGIVLGEAGDHGGAETCYRRLIAADARNVEAHFALGNTLVAQGHDEEAKAAFRRALALAPGFAPARVNLADALRRAGDAASAAAEAEAAVRAASRLPEAHLALGNAHLALGKAEAAAESFRRATELAPGRAEPWRRLGSALRGLDRPDETRNALLRAAELDPGDVSSRWLGLRILPILYDRAEDIASWRARFVAGLDALEADTRLDTTEGIARAFAGAAGPTNFLLAYQGADDRPLQERYGRLVARILAARLPEWRDPPPMPPRESDGRLRIGFVSAYFHHYTILRLFRGWVEGLDPKRFRVGAFHIGAGTDAHTAAIAARVGRFEHCPMPEYPSAEQIAAPAARIAAFRPHVLIYPEIGISTGAFLLAALRLAPVQCVSWGHPVTTGLPTMDYFLSGARMEPPGAEAHYSETLVPLPDIGILFAGSDDSPSDKSRDAYGLEDDAIVFLAGQALWKYLPGDDDVYPEIAARVPNARIAFLRHRVEAVTRRFRARVMAAFAARGLDGERFVRFVPNQKHADFLRLNAVCDVGLDSFGWSGGNTTLEALAMGLPMVTCPGRFMRGRHTKGILEMLGVTDTIAASKAAFVESAVALGRDADRRADLRARILAERSNLFGNDGGLRGLEKFLERTVADAERA